MSFLNALTNAQDGLVVDTLDNRFRELHEAVLDLKTKGTMTLKVLIEPAKFNARGEVIMVNIDFHCEVKKPALQPGASSFFVDDDRNLCRNPPGQTTIEDLVEERKNR